MKTKKNFFSWNPITTRSIVIIKQKSKTLRNKKKLFLKKKSDKKLKKNSLIPLPVQLSSVCGAPYQEKLCYWGGVLSWGVCGGRGGIPPPWPLPWNPPPPPHNIEIRIVKKKSKMFVLVLSLPWLKGTGFSLGLSFFDRNRKYLLN